ARRTPEPRTATTGRTDQPVRRDRLARPLQPSCTLRERFPQCGAKLRRIENRCAVRFDIDEIDVALFQPGEIATRRALGREGRRERAVACAWQAPAALERGRVPNNVDPKPGRERPLF